MSAAACVALLIVGAIFTFALTGSVQGIDLHVAGVVLMLAGVLGLLLTRSMGAKRAPRWRRAISRQEAIEEGALVELPADDLALDEQRRAQDRRRLWARRDRH